MNFSKKIIKWYHENKRDLPWRKTNDPYKIWISEIILQQTRIDQGTNYYLKFTNQFPDIKSLANSSENKILKLWQGLGYYTRARNLYKTANIVAKVYQGKFPSNYKEILNLKGIGEYTAAAITSIAFNQPYPVVDGNVLRLFSRYFGIISPINSEVCKKTVKDIATLLIDKKQPGTFNQAMMEFGALFCKPQNPDCRNCIFKDACIAFQCKKVDLLPIKINKIKQRSRYFYYIVIHEMTNFEEFLWIKKRSQNDIWKNLYDFPMIESNKKLSKNVIKDKIISLTGNYNNLSVKNISKEYKHVLSHQLIYSRFIVLENLTKMEINSLLGEDSGTSIKIELNNFNNYPIPKLIDNFVKESDVFQINSNQ